MYKDYVIENAREYLSRAEATYPFFVAFDSEEDLLFLKQELSTICQGLNISDFCVNDDALPDTDRLFSTLQCDVAQAYLLLGTGEYTCISGRMHFLERLFDVQLPRGKKLIVPFWNGYAFLEQKKKQDIRINFLRMAEFLPSRKYWFIRQIPNGVRTRVDAIGFKAILASLESGCTKEITARTSVQLSPQWSRKFTSAYELFCEQNPACNLPQILFTEKQWTVFLDGNRMRDNAIWSADNLLFLKQNPPKADKYLAFAVEKTESFDSFKGNLIRSILEIKPIDEHFNVFYNGWKKLMQRFPEEDIWQYVEDSRRYDHYERLSYLTDNTMVEKLAILQTLVNAKQIPSSIAVVYPSLSAYVHDFKFNIEDNQDFATFLSDYFRRYKQQKLFNEISLDFREIVQEIAEDRSYFTLPTRGSLLEKLKSIHTHLFWLDALGCEYLGFIQKKAEELGLKLHVHVSRSRLPSLTSTNRDFYEEWDSGTKEQSKKLDEVKHGNFEDCGYDRAEIPVELPYELELIDGVMSSIASRLKMGKSQKVVLASDHGATRLAVIAGDETVWEMPEKGKHSGRCCKANEYDGELPAFVTHDDENEWNVMANYNRFRGGRQADVEVHGGATLEEIVVPVIELELAEQNINIELLTKEIKVTYKDTAISLVLFCVHPLSNLSVEINGQRYYATPLPENSKKYEVSISKPKDGEHSAFVFDRDTKIGEVHFLVKNAGLNIKKDDFF